MADNDTRDVITVSVREIVEFILRSGDIDNSGAGPAGIDVMLQGGRVHRMIQQSRGTGYSAEVPLRICIPGEKYDIVIEGRADGILKDSGNTPAVTVEEIKGTYRNIEKMKEPVPVHLAQALCYAHIYMTLPESEALSEIGIKMTYVNMDDETVRCFDSVHSRAELSEWFTDLVEKYRKWADLRREWNEIRTASVRETVFPYEYRPGQHKLAVSVYQTVYEKKKLYLEAPTGCGKTLSVLFPAVKAMGERLCDRIFYLTAKTITRTAPEEAFEILRGKGLRFKTVTLTAKEKICFLEKTDCNPAGCMYAKGHYDRINDALYALVSEGTSFTREKILEYAAKYRVCPFELSLDAALFADGIICDYNYLFDPHARLKRFFEGGTSEEYIFLVDEAHNLPSRAREMYSAYACEGEFKEFRRLIAASAEGSADSIFVKKEYSKKITTRLTNTVSKLKALNETCGTDTVIAGLEKDWYKYETGIEDLIKSLERLHQTMSDYMEEREKPGMIQTTLRDKFLDLYFRISDFLAVFEDLGDDYVIYDTWSREDGLTVKLFCTDPRRKIGECLEMGRSSVLFSATMLPIQYYKGLLGGKAEDYEVYAESVFDPDNRGIFIASDVTTRYRDRSEDEFLRTADHISRIMRPKKGNYMVFFPSYAYMYKVYEIYEAAFLTPGDELILQQENMTEQEKEEFLACFEAVQNAGSDADCGLADVSNAESGSASADAETDAGMMTDSRREGSLIGFCVMGGMFSEGIDLKGDSLIGVVCVGPGIPGVDLERDILRQFYDEYDTGGMGYEYSYMYPGMNKVLQAAGRVIRTEEDKGIVVLLDKRFLSSGYKRLFPREWTSVKVTDLEHIREDITAFWNSHD